MLGSSFHIAFLLRRSKSSNSPFGQIYVRVTVDKLSRETSLNYKWEAERWDRNRSRAAGTKEDAKTLNDFIDTIHLKILEIRNGLAQTDAQITAEAIIRMLLGQSPENRMLLEVFRHQLGILRTMVGATHKPRTVQRYTSTLNHLAAFVEQEYGAGDIALEKVGHDFVSRLYNWFRLHRNCSHNTSVRYLANLKTITIGARSKGWMARDPFEDFSTAPKELPVVPLSEEELSKICRCTRLGRRLATVRDVFVFCCYTGLSYIDVKKLRPSDIKKGPDGEKWISIKREKTGSPCRIPILGVPLVILARYRRHPRAIASGTSLPVMSNQKMNAYLKEISRHCHIRGDITCHDARHTFATTITLNNGVPLETVSKMLGHSSVKQTQHYAKVLDKKVAEDMSALRERLRKKGL